MRTALKQAIFQAIGYPNAQAEDSVFKHVAGGSINAAYRFEVEGKPYFVKLNSAKRHPMMFELEANGLNGLQVDGAPRLPEVIANGYADDDAFLVLEWLESGNKQADFWETFGVQLAGLHKHTHKLFGWNEDNYIGSLFQSNSRMRHWTDFYIINRLDLQLEMAFDAGRLHQSISRMFNKLYPKLETFIPEEAPALIHGDLWSGNYLVGPQGEPVLIDPAVYYGHREIDLGMMQLFGGFSAEMYRAYDRAFPLQQGWQERIPIHQLYPLLVHVNLFGGGYVNQVENILRRFV